MVPFRGFKWLLTTLSIVFVLVIVLRLENKMISQVATLLSASGVSLQTHIDDEDWLSTASSSASSSSPIHSSLPKNDWFQHEPWHENSFTKECWHVEDICHSAHRWFYDPRSSSDPDHQPPFSLGLYQTDKTATRIKSSESTSYSSPTFLGRPKRMIVNAPLSNQTHADAISPSFLNTCRYSPIPNHVVLQSFFNDMLGEFYSRSLIYIYKIYDSITGEVNADDGNTTQRIDRRSFPEQTQMYLHVRNFPEHAKLLDSHHVFTDAFRSNALLSFTFLLDYTGCRCMKRLFLCGYDQVGTTIRGDFTNTSVMTELAPAGESGPTNTERKSPTIFRDLREQLRRNVIEANPFIQQDIAEYRAAVIRNHRPALLSLTPQQVSEFRIIGLTQRKGRRRWLNLDEVIHSCNTERFKDSDKIVCVETNIENDDVNPVRQVVIHAACDMIFGIHGAQLSEAIWMKDGSTVVELLPWIPATSYYGTWTRTTDKATPLGQIFSETPLNHIGYLLPRESAPYCKDKTDEPSLKKCFAFKLWDDRDFLVDQLVVFDVIQKFAPSLASSKPEDADAIPDTSCEELQKKAGDRKYVLYNVICADQKDRDAQLAPYVHHFLWPKDWNLTLRKIG